MIFVEKYYRCGCLDMDGQEIVPMMYLMSFKNREFDGGVNSADGFRYQTPAWHKYGGEPFALMTRWRSSHFLMKLHMSDFLFLKAVL